MVFLIVGIFGLIICVVIWARDKFFKSEEIKKTEEEIAKEQVESMIVNQEQNDE